MKKELKPKKISKPKVNKKLSMMSLAFCHEYILNNGNGTRAAAVAFNITNKELVPIPDTQLSKEDIKKKIGAYYTANSMAHKAFQNNLIREKIDELLENVYFNDQAVKRSHFRLINSRDESSVARGVDMYYKLKGKNAADKIEVTIDKKEEADNIINDFLNGESDTTNTTFEG